MTAWLLCDVSHENLSYVVRSVSYMSSSIGDPRIDEARRLRVEEELSGRQIQDRLGVSKTTLQDWLRGIPPPDWTRRPNAKDALRARAVELRGQGWSVNDIALEIGVARSTAWQWVKHLPLDLDSDRARMKRQKGKQLTDGRLRNGTLGRRLRDERRAATPEGCRGRGGRCVGPRVAVARRAGLLVRGLQGEAVATERRAHWASPTATPGWCGFSSPSWSRSAVRAIDPSYRVAIHESADAVAATRWWSEQISVAAEPDS